MARWQLKRSAYYLPSVSRVGSGCWKTERWLAIMLLVPTIALLGLFIAYPFVRGILLSVTNSNVGVPGDFVGFENLRRDLE